MMQSFLKTRGCGDILIAVTDGLKGLPEALAVVCPAMSTWLNRRASGGPAGA